MAMQKKLKLWTINIISFVLFVLLAITGLINWLVLPHGLGRYGGFMAEVRHLLMELHAWLALLFLVAIVIHLEILDYDAGKNVDLIVMGSHTKEKPSKW